MITATALWHDSTKQSSLRQEELPLPINTELLLSSAYSLISVGTESLVSKGLVPSVLHQHMTVPKMGGAFDFPIKYGYSLVAKTIDSKVGEEYFHLMHPHQDQVIAPIYSLTSLPQGVPPKRAVLASNLETAVNAIWDSEVSIGDTVLVTGFGLIGSLVARLLSMMPGVQVYISESNTYRLELANKMGFQEVEKAMDFDVAFNASANEKGLQFCIDAVGLEGKVVELSWYGTSKSTLSLGSSFHYLRKQIISSQVSHIPAKKSHRWDYERRKAVVMELLKNPIFDEHLTHEIPFEKTPQFFDQLRSGKLPNGLSWVIKY